MRLNVMVKLACALSLILLFVPGLSAPSVAASAASISTADGATAHALIVRFRDAGGGDLTPTSTQRQELSAVGASGAVASLGEPGLYRVALDAGIDARLAASSLAHDADVAYAEPDRSIRLDDSVAQYDSAPMASVDNSWALDAIQAPEAWRMGSGQGVIVAVLDTGVSPSHPDLSGRILPGWNFIQNDNDTADDAGHGTFVAGLIAGASRSDHEGVAPGVSILPVKILDGSGVGSTASFVAGINYAVNAGARIINISASGASDSAALNDALATAEAHGVLVVSSSGNDGNEQPPYPAAVSTVLAVSATDRENRLATFSSYGPYVDVAAPGVDIWSSWWSLASGDGHATASGSSASAPLVTGVAAIVAGLRPDASPAMLREIITDSAIDIAAPGIDAQTGFGLVDAQAAARIAVSPRDPGQGSISDDHGRLTLTGSGFNAGEQVMVWTHSSAGYTLNRTAHAGPRGELSVDLGPTWRFPEGQLNAYATGERSNHGIAAHLQIAAQPAAVPFQPVGPLASTADRLYFPETGHTLAYGFKQFWESHGGLAVFGFPISEEFSEKNPDTGKIYTVQYFERYRFEYHPEFAGTPAEVSLGRLGSQVATQTFPTAPPPTDSSIRYFPETQHTLGGPFRAYWESHGGLAIFGFPISEPFEEGGLLVQYFERGRFELHPDLPAGAQVLESRLGVTLAREQGYLH